MRIYYDRDADINPIKSKTVAVIGYGSQGHAHALNLRDSGVSNVAVALRTGSVSAKKAEREKFKVMEVAEAAKWADVVTMLTPDELQAEIYRDHLHANMREGATLLFAHGLNIHFNLIEPRPDLDTAWWHQKVPDTRCARLRPPSTDAGCRFGFWKGLKGRQCMASLQSARPPVRQTLGLARDR